MGDNQKNSQHNSPNASTKRTNGAFRLMRDLRDWIKSRDQFPCINAVPLDDNIFEWHCNICPDSGDFKGVIFHLIMYFDEKYPVLPPKVKLCTSIPHPNVFGEWICLDMIKRDGDNGYKNDKKYQGWTPAYSVTSILMQLESFLFSQSNVDQGDINVDRSFDPVHFKLDYIPKIEAFICDKCKHFYKQPFQITLSISKKLGSIEKKEKDVEEGKCVVKKMAVKCKDIKNSNEKVTEIFAGKNDNFCLWDGLYHDVEMLIFGFLKLNDLIKLKRVAKRFQYLVNHSKIIQVEQQQEQTKKHKTKNSTATKP